MTDIYLTDLVVAFLLGMLYMGMGLAAILELDEHFRGAVGRYVDDWPLRLAVAWVLWPASSLLFLGLHWLRRRRAKLAKAKG